MKQLTISEKFELIRHHGASISRTNTGIGTYRKSDVIESAERIIELVRSISKLHWAEEN